MATVGAANNTTVGTWRTSGIAYMSTLVMPEAGTLDSMSAYQRDFGSSDDFRFAIYVGGTSTSIDGATLLWDSGVQPNPSSGTGAWDTVTAGGESLSASDRLWIIVQTDSSSQVANVNSGDEGDFSLIVDYYLSSKGYLVSGFPTTAVAEDGNQSTSQALKAYITYTTGGGIIQQAGYHYQHNTGSGL